MPKQKGVPCSLWLTPILLVYQAGRAQKYQGEEKPGNTNYLLHKMKLSWIFPPQIFQKIFVVCFTTPPFPNIFSYFRLGIFVTPLSYKKIFFSYKNYPYDKEAKRLYVHIMRKCLISYSNKKPSSTYLHTTNIWRVAAKYCKLI